MSSNEVDYLPLLKTKPGRHFAVSREFWLRIKPCFEKNDIEPGNPNRMYVVEASKS